MTLLIKEIAAMLLEMAVSHQDSKEQLSVQVGLNVVPAERVGELRDSLWLPYV